jgi:FkbM family methyltransferase
MTKSYKKIRIDVGCAATAPNSALWILSDPDVEVLAFEPDLRNFKILNSGKSTNQYLDKPRVIKNRNIISYKNKIIKKFKNKNFKLYNFAIDNVIGKTNKIFYHVGKKNYGCSSLIKPITSKLGIKTDFKKKITVLPLSSLLKKINSNYVEMLKTDTQGNDLNVLKSAKQYIHKIVFVQSEYWANQHYIGEKSKNEARREIINYMQKKNFYCYFYTDADIFFVNKKFKEVIKRNKVLDNCLDFPSGLYKYSKWFSIYDGKMKTYCYFRDFMKFLLPKNIIKLIKYII